MYGTLEENGISMWSGFKANAYKGKGESSPGLTNAVNTGLGTASKTLSFPCVPG